MLNIFKISIDSIILTDVEYINQIGNRVWISQQIIRMQKTHYIAGCNSNTFIERIVNSTIGLRDDFAYSGAVMVNHLKGIIFGGAIDNDVFNIWICLAL
ncbi:hypothetical protein BFW25_14410 [Aeromonas caviae]|nr:hypothetical protein BFW25_14410 [Aeromonas caviae]